MLLDASTYWSVQRGKFTTARGAGVCAGIALEEVTTVYEGERRPAIRDMTVQFERGELVYVVGPNASGKTTLLETINGLLPIASGRIAVFGLDVRQHGRTVRCDIGYVPQDFMVEPSEPYRARDVVMMGRYGKIGVLNRPGDADREAVMTAMQRCGIERLADRPMGKLSGGQQQKVMIARALAKEPKILLLDEPFSNLDPEARETIPGMISRLHADANLTTVIVTHDVQGMLKTCQRVIAMNHGSIQADTTPRDWEALP